MRRSILDRRKRHRIQKTFELQITSMMDMLIIIVVFMLKSYSLNSVAFATSSNIKLPPSSALEMPSDSLSIIIEPKAIIVDNEKILEFTAPPEVTAETATYEIDKSLLSEGNRKIIPLYDALMKAKEKTELLMSKAKWVAPQDPTNPNAPKEIVPPKFQGVLVIQADKAVRYDLIKKIMYTAGSAEYKTFKFAALRKDEM